MAKTRTGGPSNGGSGMEIENGSGPTADNRSDAGIDASANAIAGFDPADLGVGNGSAKPEPSSEPTVKRGRGRPAGSGNRKPTQKSQDVSVSGTEKLLLGIHNALAIGLKCDEIALEDKDAKLLAESISNVAQHYQTAVDPKTLAWLGLAGVIGAIYVPRIMALMDSRKKKGDEKPKLPEQPANVMPFNPQAFTG